MPGSEVVSLTGWRTARSLENSLSDCSLIVATYQRPREVARLLETLKGLPDQPGEVVVVDGSEEKDTEVSLSEWHDHNPLRFDLVYVRSPKGLTRQRNVGIDISSGEYVFFLDDDCLPQSGYFAAMRKVLVEDRMQKIGAMCGLIINEMNQPVPRRWRIRLAIGLVPKLEPRIYHPSCTSVPRNTIHPFSGVRPVDIVDGGASLFRRTVLKESRFSEFFYGYSQGEDLEMSLRTRRKWKILWCGDAHVVHYHATSGRPPSFEKGFMEVRNRYFIWKRHSPHCTMKDKARFWLDILFLVCLDLGYLFRPPHIPYLAHALGLMWGATTCLITPPTYEEPPPRQQYRLMSASP